MLKSETFVPRVKVPTSEDAQALLHKVLPQARKLDSARTEISFYWHKDGEAPTGSLVPFVSIGWKEA